MSSKDYSLRIFASLRPFPRNQSYQQLCFRCLATQRQQIQVTDLSRESAVSLFPRPKKYKTPHQLTNVAIHPLPKLKAVPSPPSTAKAHPFPLRDWEKLHLKVVDPKGARSRLFDPSNSDRPKVGDIILCTFRTGEPFSGVCLNVRRRGLDTAVLLRNKLLMNSVEMWVKIYSPNVKSVELVQKAAKRPRRAKLYYMRKPKHDRGSVEGVVEQYLKRRRLIRGGDLTMKAASAKKKKNTKAPKDV